MAIRKLSPALVKKYGIPDWAMRFDGINAPEGGIFIGRREGATRLGQKVPFRDYNTNKMVTVVTTHDLGNGEFIATHFHNERDRGPFENKGVAMYNELHDKMHKVDDVKEAIDLTRIGYDVVPEGQMEAIKARIMKDKNAVQMALQERLMQGDELR